MTMVTIPMDITDLDSPLGRHEGHWRVRCAECGLEYRLAKADRLQTWGPRRVLDDFGRRAGWHVDRHPRMLADVTGNGRADIVGFGDTGVWIALGRGDGSFDRPRLALESFGARADGWRMDRHLRLLADVTGNGRADIVGFGDAGVWIALARGDGSFAPPRRAIADFGHDHGWRIDRHPRLLADVMGRGRPDIVGFGQDGTWIAPNEGEGRFGPPRRVSHEFGIGSGWRPDRHLRWLADLTGEGRADIVGFGEDGVMIARNRGEGRFDSPELVLPEFGARTGGWRIHRHPRFLADVTGKGRPDIVGFSEHGVWVAINEGEGRFGRPQRVIEDFGAGAGGWRVDLHPRMLGDLAGEGRADIVGFGDTGVVVALAKGDGTFESPRQLVDAFGSAAGWRPDQHPVALADLTGDGRVDIVGFGDDGVHVALTSMRPPGVSVLVPLEEHADRLVTRRPPSVVGPRPLDPGRRAHHHHHGLRSRRA